MATYQHRKNQNTDKILKFADFKDLWLMRKFVSQWGRNVPRYYSGLPVQAQKKIALAVKRARFMGLIPFVK